MRNARTDKYDIMCSIDAHEKQQPSYVDDGIRGDCNEVPPNLTTEALDSLGEAFYFIDCWLTLFDQNYQALSNIYGGSMQYLFKKIQVQLSKPPSHRNKLQ